MTRHNTVAAEVFTRPIDRIRLHLDGPSRPFDARSTAIRKDLADVAASGQHLSPHYAESIPHLCVSGSAIVTGSPDDRASAVTQLLAGETFHVLDILADWAWGYCDHDHYVGYVAMAALSRNVGAVATHRIVSQGALLFTRPDIKSPATALPGGSQVRGILNDDFLAIDGGGFVHRRHVTPIDEIESDWVAVAQRYLGMPYLWGGRGGGGIDCSGLVQQALGRCGIAVARDTDQQIDTIGRALEADESLLRGDIIFFPGHVGIMSDAETLCHANAHWMCVVEEPLADVITRLLPLHGEPVSARRRITA